MKHVVYLHGLGGTCKNFNYLKPALPRHRATFIEYDGTKGLDASYNEIISSIPSSAEISIIGHSLGGLLAVMICLKSDLKIDQCITIGTPFGGCKSASMMKWFMPTVKILRDISPGSKALSELRKADLPNLTSIVCTAGDIFIGKIPFFFEEDNDGVVSIQSQLESPGKIIQIDANHFEIMQDPKTVKVVKKLIF